MCSGKTVEVYTDGASRGNPGESGIGVLIVREDSTKEEIKEYIGKGTNNEAEYKALIRALRYLSEHGIRAARVHTDSKLVANQINGLWKVKDSKLKILHEEVKNLISNLEEFKIGYVPRNRNVEADRLANEAIDGYFKD